MFELPKLSYGYDALEPYIDAKTMEIHHSKHHQAYTDKFNAAIKGHEKMEKMKADDIIKNLNHVPEGIRTAVRNNGGGYVNHNFFWQVLKKDVQISGDIKVAINQKFDSFEKFKEEFASAASTHFGSGWAWLVLNKGKLEIMATPNQDSPLTQGKTPLLTIDVWEHAYYLKYMNKRPAYVDAFFNVINWDKVNELYKNTKR